ncbi:cystatin-C-like [Asterias amurensis]|uniref:cystatin-C-like n=1 Tax=Asterias amurensis TaxID=7602 RepID=UPI003AB44EB3
MQSILLLSLLVGILLVVPSLVVEGGLLGGLEPAKVYDDGVVRAAHFAVVELNKKSNALFASKLTDIKSAKKQVVQGMRYYLSFVMSQTKCKLNNGLVLDLDSCDTDNKVKQLCTVIVSEFMGKSKLEEDSCKTA